MKDTITFDDFLKLDIRVGQIIEAVAPEWSNKLIEMKVDFGEEIGQRTILSGIKKWYTPEDIQGKKAPFIINLEPRKMGPSESQGMMMMADAEDKPTLIFVDQDVVVGTSVL
jgi:methionyl-tRNA synthetase